MAELFRLSGKQWRSGLALCAIVGPLVASLPLAVAVLIADGAPFWHNLPAILVIGAIDGLIFASLPALVLGAVALALAQRVIRNFGFGRARRRILAIGAGLGAAIGAVLAALLYAAAVPTEGGTASLATLALLALGALTGLGVAAFSLRLLRRQLSA